MSAEDDAWHAQQEVYGLLDEIAALRARVAELEAERDDAVKALTDAYDAGMDAGLTLHDPASNQATDGGRNPFYEGTFDDETAEQAEHRRREALAAKPSQGSGEAE